MTPEEAKARVAAIESESDDDEVAHSLEDDLWGDVLAAIADDSPHAAELARIALSTQEIKFARWYA